MPLASRIIKRRVRMRVVAAAKRSSIDAGVTMRRNSGFTLVEIMIVLGILGILLAIVYRSVGAAARLTIPVSRISATVTPVPSSW